MTRRASQPIGDDAEWARGVVARAWRSDIGSSDNEVRFLMDMDRGLDRFGARMFVSERQRAWLERIERRLDPSSEAGAGGEEAGDEVLR